MSLIPTQYSEPVSGVVQHTARFSLDDFPLEAIQQAGIELPFSLQSAVKKRQYEFLMSRYCAKLCLEQLGLRPAPLISADADRSPIWPEGFVGSITHTEGWAGAIVGKQSAVRSVGIDFEHEIDRDHSSLVQHICLEEAELDAMSTHLNCSRERALTIIFSAKESFYKAMHPHVKRFFGFHAARVIPAEKDGIAIELLTHLTDELMLGRTWPLRLRKVGGDVLETLLIEFP